MRVTVSHNKPKQQVRDAVDQSLDKIVSGIAVGPIQFTDQKKMWTGDTMNFSLTAQMGFLRTPLKGWIQVGDTDVTIDVDLGIFENLIPQDKAKTALSGTVRGLLT